MTARLLNQKRAAEYLGINRDRFRRIVKAGNGPKIWNPDGGLPLYAVAVLDQWVESRNDPYRRRFGDVEDGGEALEAS